MSMPFYGIGKGMYQSPSGRKYTAKQVKMYYATEGFNKAKVKAYQKKKAAKRKKRSP